MPYRNGPDDEIKLLSSFKYLNLLKPNEHTEDYYNRGSNDKNFLFEMKLKMKNIFLFENIYLVLKQMIK